MNEGQNRNALAADLPKIPGQLDEDPVIQSTGGQTVEGSERPLRRPRSQTVISQRKPWTARGSAVSLSVGFSRPVPAGNPKPDGAVRPLDDLLVPTRIPTKRILDLLGAAVGLALASPLFLAIAVLIKTVSPGPALFRQERIGYRGQPFVCWKFRTMHVDADEKLHRQHIIARMKAGGALSKLDDTDPRIIPVGTLLRKSGLDELPQLVNVLRGEMSLVGPRPCLAYEAREYSLWQRRRFEAIPGLTGLWQVSGKNGRTFQEMTRLDLSYLDRSSCLTDVRIILRTIPVIIRELVYARRQGQRQRA